MNLLLFSSEEELRHIKPGDPRLPHVRQVLRPGDGGRLYVGLLGGKRAWATVLRDDPAQGMFTEPQWETQQPPAPLPLRVLVGLPRPQTARRVLFEAAALGVAQLDFFQSEKGEPSYAKSSLWHSSEWYERLWQGAEQACVTTLPSVRIFDTLAAALSNEPKSPLQPPNTEPPHQQNELLRQQNELPQKQSNSLQEQAPLSADLEVRLALDIYEAVAPLTRLVPPASNLIARTITLAIGSERGWSAAERTLLTDHNFLLTHIGERILRTETAFVAAVSLVADKLLHAE